MLRLIVFLLIAVVESGCMGAEDYTECFKHLSGLSAEALMPVVGEPTDQDWSARINKGSPFQLIEVPPLSDAELSKLDDLLNERQSLLLKPPGEDVSPSDKYVSAKEAIEAIDQKIQKIVESQRDIAREEAAILGAMPRSGREWYTTSLNDLVHQDYNEGNATLLGRLAGEGTYIVGPGGNIFRLKNGVYALIWSKGNNPKGPAAYHSSPPKSQSPRLLDFQTMTIGNQK